jgi:8-oxo-dGTP diphosphatase
LKDAHFFVAHATKEQMDNIVFGSEGQYWQLMDPHEFLDSTNAVPYLQKYLADFIAEAA